MQSITRVTARHLLLAALFSLALLVQPAQAAAPKQVAHYTSHEDGAFALFATAEGCLATEVTVFASKGMVKEGTGKPTPSAGLFVYLRRFDSCTNTLIFDAFSDMQPGEFDGSLQSAELTADVSLCCDEGGAAIPASLDLAWTATGPVEKDPYTYHSNKPGCIVHYTALGLLRPAVATGSITALGSELAADPAVDALLRHDTAGSLEVGCD